MKNKRIIIFLCVFMLAGIISGCDKKVYITTGLKESEMFKLSGEPCTTGEILLVLMTEKSRYEAELGVDIWNTAAEKADVILEDEIKQKVKNEMIELKAIEKFADTQGIVLSDEEKTNIKSAAEEYYDGLTDEEKEDLSVSVADVENLYTSFYKSELVYDKLISEVEVEISDEEARVINVNYIFIATCKLGENGNKLEYTEEELAEANAKAQNVQKLLDVGNDFVSIAMQYSDSSTYNRIFARGDMVEAFEKAAFDLETGEISSIVQTEDGYYYIQCISDYLKNETNTKKLEMENNVRKEAYYEIYNPFKVEQTLEFNNKIWDGLKLADYTGISTTNLYDVYNKWMCK